MTAARAKGIVLTLGVLTALGGCSLFSDFGGFSDAPAPVPDSGSSGTTDAPSADSNGPPPDAGPAIDAGSDASAYKQAVLADQPVAYWPLDEAAGANVAREVIGARNADVVGTLSFGASGVDGTALERGSSGGYLDVGDYFDLTGQKPYSIEFWGWPKGDGQFEDILHKRDGTGKGWIVYFRDGSQSVQIEHTYAAGQRGTFAGVPSAKTKFHHIVFVYDPVDPTDKRSRVYIDNVRTNGYSDDGPADDVAKALHVMSFVGLLDEIAIYDRALTAERVTKHFELGPK